MVDYSGCVLDFHTKYGQAVRTTPTIPDDENEKSLRYKLIEEECSETLKALKDNNIVEVADGLADLLYVVFGTAHSYGIPLDEIFDEVHRSNMSKTRLGHTKSGDKIQKGNYSPVDILTILHKHGYLSK